MGIGRGAVWIPGSSLRDERLPKGPRFASESLDADTGGAAVFQTAPLPGHHLVSRFNRASASIGQRKRFIHGSKELSNFLNRYGVDLMGRSEAYCTPLR